MTYYLKGFAQFIEGMWFADGKESEDSRRWFKKDPNFGDLTRKQQPQGTSVMGNSNGMMMNKKMKKKMKKN